MSSKQQRTTVRYSISFKQMVVKEIEEGVHSVDHVRRKYGIGGGATIYKWISNFGKNHLLNKIIKVETMDERDRLKQLEEENKRLKMALADAFMAKDCLEGVIKMANKEYKTDLKKNFGDRLPGDLKENIK
jgi:transposase-like protein